MLLHPEVAVPLSEKGCRCRAAKKVAPTSGQRVYTCCQREAITEISVDIILPLHDASGKMIGTLGMDFRSEAGQQEAGTVERATRIAREIEKLIRSKDALFKSVE